MPTIPELQKLGGLPKSSEWVLPVCWVNTAQTIRSISIDELVKSIKDAVLEGGEVEVYEHGAGIRFRRVVTGEFLD